MVENIKLKEPPAGVPNNIKLNVENGKLLIEVDLEKEIALSSSGKTMVVATSRGSLLLFPFADRDEDKDKFGAYRINMTCYKPRVR